MPKVIKPAVDPWERLEQLARATAPPENSFTSTEVAARKGWPRYVAWRWLETQVKEGKLKRVGRRGSEIRYFFPES